MKMFHFLRFSSHFLRFNSIHAIRIQSLPNPSRKCHCQTNPPFSVVEYLQTSLGFSQEMALTLSQRLKGRNPKNPDSVLAFLKSHGLSETRIKAIINRAPFFLCYVSPESSLRPKMQFLKDKGISESDLGDLMVANPFLFSRSLERYIKPLVNLLGNVLGTNEFAVQWLIRSKLTFSLQTLSANMTTLMNHSVQDRHIMKLFMRNPRTLDTKSDRFTEVVEMVEGMGFKPQTRLFVDAVVTILGLSRHTWDAKLKVYTSLGLSVEEILTLFHRHPICMKLSEEKIRMGFCYLTKELGWRPSNILRAPTILFLSLEKRLMPRHRFLQFLASNGFIKKNKIFAYSFMMSENKFLKNFVMRYESKVPDILKVYEGLIGSKLQNIRDGEHCNVQ